MKNDATPKPIRVGLDPSLASWSAEIKYVFRTLLRVAGYPFEFVWANGTDTLQALDIYYGPGLEQRPAAVTIAACGKPFTSAPWLEPLDFLECDGMPFLDFTKRRDPACHSDQTGLRFSNDIIFATYWLLTGAREPEYPRDRRDNLYLEGSFFLENDLASKPLVSIYGSLLREHFRQLGRNHLKFPWISPRANAAFVLSHDVDYPQMIRWVEVLRVLGVRGPKSTGTIMDIIDGTNHFWKFAEWIEFTKKLGTRPAFYFLARRGSLPHYILGRPDGFYDIRSPEFAKLFQYLNFEGCEIGLHASYNAYYSTGQLQHEKQVLEKAAGVQVNGNRHHYWHLDAEAPHETLRRHEQIGLFYDSSLAFEFYPGFRRGSCHPFHPFHPSERRELDIIELPPAWMDDHFDRRLEKNKILDPVRYASELVKTAQATNGIIVVDYHVRGMNHDFYPRFGSWLMEFVQNHLDSSISFHTPGELVQKYIEYEECLEAHSKDLTEPDRIVYLEDPKGVEVSQPVTVDLIRKEEEDEWESFVATHPHGNIYHTIAWKAVTEDGFGHQAHYLRALDPSGQFAGVLPLFLVKGLFGRRLVSVPMRDRGGVLAKDSETTSLLISRAIELTRELDCKYLELRSLQETDSGILNEHNLQCKRQWTTTRLDLSPGVENLWKALDRNAIRWAINKARKQGVRYEIDNTQKGIEIFYEMFVHTRRLMGIPPFPKDLFVSIWHHLISQNKANLFLVRKESEPINAMINLLSNDTFIPAYAAPQNEWRKYYPNEFIFWHTIEWATEQGFHYYDFGADSPRQIGLLWFKKKWGGLHHPMSYCYFLNGPDAPPNFDSSAPIYSLVRRAWAGLPTSLCKPLGSWVTRQLS